MSTSKTSFRKPTKPSSAKAVLPLSSSPDPLQADPPDMSRVPISEMARPSDKTLSKFDETQDSRVFSTDDHDDIKKNPLFLALLQENASLKEANVTMTSSILAMQANLTDLTKQVCALTDQVGSLTTELINARKGAQPQKKYSQVVAPEASQGSNPGRCVDFKIDAVKAPVLCTEIKKSTGGKTGENKIHESTKPGPVKKVISEIKNSKWVGSRLMYQVSLVENPLQDYWLAETEFQADSIVKTFHELNPGAPAPADFEYNKQWKTGIRREKSVGKKLAAKKQLTSEDIEFIAFGLTKPKEVSKEFKKLHLRIENKRILKNCSYKQKQAIIMKVLHSYGLSGCVSRISFIGSSVLEVYVLAETESKFKSGMQRNDWKFIGEFDYYAPAEFNEIPVSKEKEESCLSALIQRLAFLCAGTKLINLKECILEGLQEETQVQVLKREQEIKESRNGQRTAYVLPSQ